MNLKKKTNYLEFVISPEKQMGVGKEDKVENYKQFYFGALHCRKLL